MEGASRKRRYQHRKSVSIKGERYDYSSDQK